VRAGPSRTGSGRQARHIWSAKGVASNGAHEIVVIGCLYARSRRLLTFVFCRLLLGVKRRRAESAGRCCGVGSTARSRQSRPVKLLRNRSCRSRSCDRPDRFYLPSHGRDRGALAWIPIERSAELYRDDSRAANRARTILLAGRLSKSRFLGSFCSVVRRACFVSFAWLLRSNGRRLRSTAGLAASSSTRNAGFGWIPPATCGIRRSTREITVPPTAKPPLGTKISAFSRNSAEFPVLRN
jgi:hypothetical protein